MKITRDNWRDHADCLGEDPDLWQPEDGGSAVAAIRICHSCTVNTFCLVDALTYPVSLPGIYGGTGKRERDRMRQAGAETWPKLNEAAA